MIDIAILLISVVQIWCIIKQKGYVLYLFELNLQFMLFFSLSFDDEMDLYM